MRIIREFKDCKLFDERNGGHRQTTTRLHECEGKVMDPLRRLALRQTSTCLKFAMASLFSRMGDHPNSWYYRFLQMRYECGCGRCMLIMLKMIDIQG